MKKLLTALLLVLTLQLPAWAGLTLVQRETFATRGAIAAGADAELGTVSIDAGSGLYAERYGPFVTGTDAALKGWSADMRQSRVRHQISNTSDRMLFDQWFYVSSFSIGSAGGWMNAVVSSDSNNVLAVGIANGSANLSLLDSYASSFGVIDLGVAVPIGQWFELRTAVERVGNTFNYSILYRLAGAASFTTIRDTSVTISGRTIASVIGGLRNSQSGGINGRYGMPALYTMAAYADRSTLISDVTDPPTRTTAGYDWYIDPTNGNDANDGSSLAQAIKTPTEVTRMAANCGFFPTKNPWRYAADNSVVDVTRDADVLEAEYSAGKIRLAGDTLYVALNAGAEQRVTSTLTIAATEGMTTRSTTLGSQASLTQFKIIIGSSWTKTAGRTNIYETTDRATDNYLYQNRRPFNHLTGASFAAIAATLDASPGYFFDDGTKLYCYPFDGVDPTLVGSNAVFERTQITGSGGVGIVTTAANCRVMDLKFTGTTLVNQNSGNIAVGGYAFQVTPGGLCVVHRCTGDYTDKHTFGAVGTYSNARLLWLDLSAARDNPVAGIGGTSNYVDFCSTGGSGNQFFYRNCTNQEGNRQTIGSQLGNVNLSSNPWICHSLGTETFTKGWFVGCDFTGGAQLSIQLSTPVVKAYGSRFTMAATHPLAVFEDCTYTELSIPGGTYRRCAFLFHNATSTGVSNGNLRTDGITGVFEDCLFDFRNLSSTSVAYAFGKLSTSGSFTFRRCTILLPTGVALFSGNTTADTIRFQGCRWVLADGASQSIINNYNDGSTTAARTLAQLQALGIDDGGTILTSVIDYSIPQVWPGGRRTFLNVGSGAVSQ